MVVAITGASAGIGRQLAVDLHARGAKLALSARRLDRLELLNRDLGGGHLVLGADVSREEDCRHFVTACVERFGRIDTMVANAGYAIPAKLHESAPADVEAVFRTNVFGTIDVCRAAIRVMLHQPKRDGLRGQVMIVSSAAARRGLPYMGVYSATKAAQLSLAEALRVELKGESIAVTSVHPIGTQTDFFTVAQSGGAPKIEDALRKNYRQSAAHVTKKMVDAIEKTRPEVWPHGLTRLLVALNALFPRIGDGMMRRQMREIDQMNRETPPPSTLGGG
jgi:short-subunit dehydrogenase